MTDPREGPEALEPCPFCGAEAFEWTDAAVVECTKCDTEKHGTDPQAAIAAWNRRASLASRVDAEGLERVIREIDIIADTDHIAPRITWATLRLWKQELEALRGHTAAPRDESTADRQNRLLDDHERAALYRRGFKDGAAAAAPQEADGWRDMAELRGGIVGERILAVVDGRVTIVVWGKASHVPWWGWCEISGPEDAEICYPTAWMPLPPSPLPQEAE